jgi:hypothetical protein
MIDMKAISLHTLATALALALAATLAGQVKARGELIKFPESYAQGVHYATVDRGHPARSGGLDSAGSTPRAWRLADPCHDAHRQAGTRGRYAR